jgi:hypothetical protein
MCSESGINVASVYNSYAFPSAFPPPHSSMPDHQIPTARHHRPNPDFFFSLYYGWPTLWQRLRLRPSENIVASTEMGQNAAWCGASISGLMSKYCFPALSWGIGLVCSKGVRCVLNTEINHGRTELCNVSRFGSILLPVHSEVE